MRIATQLSRNRLKLLRHRRKAIESEKRETGLTAFEALEKEASETFESEEKCGFDFTFQNGNRQFMELYFIRWESSTAGTDSDAEAASFHEIEKLILREEAKKFRDLFEKAKKTERTWNHACSCESDGT